MTSPSQLTVSKIETTLHAHQAELRRLGVASLAVFGSVGRGEATDASDIDFLVDFTGSATLTRYMDLKLLLETIFERKIDLVTRKALRSRLQPLVERDAVRVA